MNFYTGLTTIFQDLAFPMNVIALLPYMVQHYEDANELCIRSAENIAAVSSEKNKKLENLATVMTLYSRRTFSKESFQWTKCVVKYLHDLYSRYSFNMLGFLVEILEKGNFIVQSSNPKIHRLFKSYKNCQIPFYRSNLNSSPNFNHNSLPLALRGYDNRHPNNKRRFTKNSCKISRITSLEGILENLEIGRHSKFDFGCSAINRGHEFPLGNDLSLQLCGSGYVLQERTSW